ncbi:ubiquitin-conjugating enzyme E2-binding protein [Cladochytrium replicatum]|nr:ubiquitin-conjugating enzyme E2-binding protein [Cladochytrium replicatum]
MAGPRVSLNADLLANLRSLTLTAKVVDSDSHYTLAAQCSSSSTVVVTIKGKEVNHRLSVELPIEIDETSIRVSNISMGATIRARLSRESHLPPLDKKKIVGNDGELTSAIDSLSIGTKIGDEDSKSSKHFVRSHLPTSAELQNLSQLSCRSCGSLLTCPLAKLHQNPFDRILDHPSEYWHELIDCWTCHKEEYTTVEKSGHLGGIFGAKARTLLVGGSYVLMHPDDLRNECVEERKRETDEPSSSLRKGRRVLLCSTCKEIVGESYRTGSHSARSVRLFSYCINIQVSSEMTKNPIVFCAAFERYFVQEILEAAQAHASYKFCICSEDNQSIFLLWLQTMEMFVGKQEFICEREEMKKPLRLERVVRVLYLSDKEAKLDPEKQFMEKWQEDRQIERMVYPAKFVESLLQLLEESNARIEPEYRRMQVFRVGTLMRSTK